MAAQAPPYAPFSLIDQRVSSWKNMTEKSPLVEYIAEAALSMGKRMGAEGLNLIVESAKEYMCVVLKSEISTFVTNAALFHVTDSDSFLIGGKNMAKTLLKIRCIFNNMG